MCVCVCAFQIDARPAGYARTSMADSSEKTAGSRVSAKPLWQKVVGLCGPSLSDLRVWNEDEKTTGASRGQRLPLQSPSGKGCEGSVHNQMQEK